MSENVKFCANSLFISPVSEDTVSSLISRLKATNAFGIDDVSYNLIKRCKQHLFHPLCYLINLSFERGIFPDKCKTAIIRPVYKKGNPNEHSNYRSISLLSSFSKIFELALRDQLMSFCLLNNVISSAHGFTAGRSTETEKSKT